MYPILSAGSPSVQKLMMTESGAVQHIEFETPELDIQINFVALQDFKDQCRAKMSEFHQQTADSQNGDSTVTDIIPVLQMQGVPLDKAFQPAIDAQMALSQQQQAYRKAVVNGMVQKMDQTRQDVGQSLRAVSGQVLGGVPDLSGNYVSGQSLQADKDKETFSLDSVKEKVKKHVKPWMVLAGIALALLAVGYLFWLVNPKAPFAAD